MWRDVMCMTLPRVVRRPEVQRCLIIGGCERLRGRGQRDEVARGCERFPVSVGVRSARFDSARLDSTRLGSARLDSTRLDSSERARREAEAEVEATCARRLAVDGRWWRGGVGGVAALGWRGGGGFKIFVEKTINRGPAVCHYELHAAGRGRPTCQQALE